jgi:hypothetical protein
MTGELLHAPMLYCKTQYVQKMGHKHESGDSPPEKAVSPDFAIYK